MSMDDRTKDGQPFASKAEMMTAMKDERYRKDEAFEARVKARVAATDFSAVTGALINEPLPMGNVRPEIEEVNAAMPQGFQTVSDFMKMIKSPEYKTNAAYRLAVEGAIAAATPDWHPRTGEEGYSVAFEPNIP